MMKKLFSSMIAGLAGTLFLAAAPALAAGGIKVECWGNCNTVNLGQICDRYVPNSTPIAVSCSHPGTYGTATGCGSGPACYVFGSYWRSDLLGDYCVDGAGPDAVVTCSANPGNLSLPDDPILPKTGER